MNALLRSPEQLDAVQAELTDDADSFREAFYDIDANVPEEVCIARQLHSLRGIPRAQRAHALLEWHDALCRLIHEALEPAAEKELARREQRLANEITGGHWAAREGL